ncbi:MAG: CPBP family intramembrane metalloprotease [Clostridiales bacterium]|nr:CPBP family intramembrane metalloprotease [Clostridiales bacterium]
MNELSTQKKWQIWKGVILQVACIALLLFVGFQMQVYWGMIGLVATELMFLIVAVAYALIKKTPLKEVFPIKKPRGRHLAATFFIWVGGLLFGLLGLGISSFLFPKLLGDTVTGLHEFLIGDSVLAAVISFLVVACMPPFCEEAIERGAVLSHFRSLKGKDWVIVLVMGIFFGIFHLDPVRFLTTAVLGAALTYVMVKTDNMIYPMLLHFVNNAFSTLLANLSSLIYGSDAVDVAVESYSNFDRAMGLQLISSYLILGFAAPVMIALGMTLFQEKLPKNADRAAKVKRSNQLTIRFVAATVISGIMLASGMFLMFKYVIPSPEYQEQYDQIMEQMMEAEEGTIKIIAPSV